MQLDSLRELSKQWFQLSGSRDGSCYPRFAWQTAC